MNNEIKKERDMMARTPWTPPSNVAAWLRKYDIENPKGRDYEALTKAALRKPVGWWGDEPKENPSEWPPKLPGEVEPACEGLSPSAPATSAPQHAADDLYEPVGTPPVVGDKVRCSPQTCADGPDRSLARYDTLSQSWDTSCGYWLSWLWFSTGDVRILKRQKPATVRAWSYHDGLVFWVLADGVLYVGNSPWERSVRKLSDMADYAELPHDEALRLNEERLRAKS